MTALPGPAHLLREAGRLLVRHARVVLPLALIGLAAPAWLEAMLPAAVSVSRQVTGIGLDEGMNTTRLVLRITQLGLGVLLVLPARTALLWTFSQSDSHNVSITDAIRVGARGQATQLAVAVAYGGALLLAALGVLGLLRMLRLDDSDFLHAIGNAPAFAQALAARALGGLLPDPGPPAAELLGLIRIVVQIVGVERMGASSLWATLRAVPGVTWLIGLVGLALAVVIEGVLRLRAVATLDLPLAAVPGALVGVIKRCAPRLPALCARWWALRLMRVAFDVVLIVAPTLALRNLVADLLAIFTSRALYVVGLSGLGALGGLALTPIYAAITALGLACEVVLWRAIREAR
ncbi:MAG: hypothetical protein K1X39_14390 [Thermoflexales bacterium]|nr:hypothetical protein [Thermoflexales bacterium]